MSQSGALVRQSFYSFPLSADGSETLCTKCWGPATQLENCKRIINSIPMPAK